MDVAGVLMGAFALCAFDLQRIAITHLKGSSLPHVTMAGMGWGTAVWWGCIYQWVLEGYCLCGLPHAAGAGGGRNI